jgi:alginate O-acetyltransferase complex protein AlgI
MVFSSIVFLFLFLPLFLGLYFLLPRAWRNVVLLGASVVFYFWGEGWLLWILALSTAIDYTAGLLIAGCPPWRRPEPLDPDGPRSAGQRLALTLSIVTNLGLLAAFKYFNFGVDNYNWLVGSFGLSRLALFSVPTVVLPLGISFFTFQSMSYTIDVYRGRVTATSSLLRFATYVTMFPQLVAGPIVRYLDVAEELEHRETTASGFSRGIERFVVGLAKKVLIANTVAQLADGVFELPPEQLTTAAAWLGVLAYTLQIYFDFSGYSDMAIGLGLMLGFHFPENFRWPYISRSIQEFWRRWHISLSTWFRDYLYIPLGGSRGGTFSTYRNLVLVFLLCGLWHGASWNFVIWGVFHGFFLVVERAGLAAWLERVPRFVRHGYVLLAVMVGWVFFRADTLPEALAFLRAMGGFADAPAALPLAMLVRGDVVVALVLGVVGSMPLVPWLRDRWHRLRDRAAAPGRADLGVQAGATVALFVLFGLIALRLSASAYNPFIYFRF